MKKLNFKNTKCEQSCSSFISTLQKNKKRNREEYCIYRCVLCGVEFGTQKCFKMHVDLYHFDEPQDKILRIIKF